MAESTGILRRLRQSTLRLLETGFEAMVRYPYDLCEMPWYDGLHDDNPGPGDSPNDPPTGPGPSDGRTIKLVPPPASRRYHAEGPRRIPVKTPKSKQPV